MKKNVLPSKLNLESHVPGAESAFEEVHRRCNSKLSPGDVALLQFALCAELVESDLWTQYAELGGVGRSRLVYTISKRREPGRRRGILGTVRDSKPAGDTAGRLG